MSSPDFPKSLLYVVATALLAVAVHVMLRRPAGSQQARDLIRLIDQDADGRLGSAEVVRALDDELSFEQLDLDDSGALDPWEVDVILLHISPMRWGLGALPRTL